MSQHVTSCHSILFPYPPQFHRVLPLLAYYLGVLDLDAQRGQTCELSPLKEKP